MLGTVGASFGFGNFEVVGSRLFFAGSDPATGSELWVTDGTSQGTTLVADLAPGPASSGLFHFNDLGGTLVFFSEKGGLMKSDGSAGGTLVVTPLKVDTSDAAPGNSRRDRRQDAVRAAGFRFRNAAALVE